MKSKLSKNGNKDQDLTLFYDQLRNEPILNSPEQLTVIPAQTKYKEVNSRVLLLQIDGKIKHVLFNMIADETVKTTSHFNGRLIITDLDLKFISGFKVENGSLVSRYLQKTNHTKSNENDDEYVGDLSELEEVWITYNASYNYNGQIELTQAFYDDGGANHDGIENFSWTFGGGGASSTLSSEEENVILFLEQDVWNEDDPYDDWNKLTKCEKEFFRRNPSFLYSASINRKAAVNYANQFFPTCNQHNDIADAFRHFNFSARNYQNMGYYNAKLL